MKSVKPGRGPSLMSGIRGVAVGAFGVIWTAAAVGMDAPGIFTAFGIVFVLIAIGGAIYDFLNASGKKRFSSYDITDEDEEPDPLNERFGESSEAPPRAGANGEAGYCPYCGARAEDGYRFCAKCGRALPKDES